MKVQILAHHRTKLFRLRILFKRDRSRLGRPPEEKGVSLLLGNVHISILKRHTILNFNLLRPLQTHLRQTLHILQIETFNFWNCDNVRKSFSIRIKALDSLFLVVLSESRDIVLELFQPSFLAWDDCVVRGLLQALILFCARFLHVLHF